MATTLEALEEKIDLCIGRVNDLTRLINTMPSGKTYREFSTLIEAELDSLTADVQNLTNRVINLEIV